MYTRDNFIDTLCKVHVTSSKKMGSIDWLYVTFYGSEEDLVWSQWCRQHKDHQAFNHLHPHL